MIPLQAQGLQPLGLAAQYVSLAVQEQTGRTFDFRASVSPHRGNLVDTTQAATEEGFLGFLQLGDAAEPDGASWRSCV